MVKSTIAAIALTLFLAGGAVSAEFSADMVMETFAGANTGKVYFKNPDVNRTEMMGTISIIKRPIMYQLFTDTKMYVIQNLDDIKKDNPMADAASFKEWMQNNNLKKTGSETVQGYDCEIYEGDIKMDEEQPSVHIKLWYAKKLDYPVKQETELPPPAGKISSRLENINVASQPNSLFDIPDGYTQTKDYQEAMGMGGMPSFEGGDEGSMPSQEDMEKMMQEMMKQMGKQQ
jgi:hypothetical protein